MKIDLPGGIGPIGCPIVPIGANPLQRSVVTNAVQIGHMPNAVQIGHMPDAVQIGVVPNAVQIPIAVQIGMVSIGTIGAIRWIGWVVRGGRDFSDCRGSFRTRFRITP